MADPTPTYATVTLQGPLMFDTWTTATRPTTPLVGATGLNTDLSEVETWSGSGWTTKVVSVVGSAGIVTLGELVSGGVAPLASPALTGSPTAPTPTTSDNSTLIATTAYVTAKVASTTSGVSTVNGRSGAITLALSDIPGAAPLASPTFTGSPAAPTPTTDDNDTSIATTAYVLGQLSAAPPVMDGSATVGVSTRIARADHVHPTDTSRYAASNPSGYQTAAQVTAVLPTAATALPLMDAAASVGIGTTWARGDHVHPSDTSRAPIASPTFTGTPVIPYQAPYSGAAARTYSAKVGDFVSALDFAGVDPTGATNSSSGLQAALNCGAKAIILPPGNYVASGLTMPVGTSFLGLGRFVSVISNPSATANTIDATASFCEISGIGFITTATRTAGAYVNFGTGSTSTLRDFQMSGAFVGVTFSGAITQVRNGLMINGVPGTAGNGSGSGGILVGALGNGDAQLIDNVVMSAVPGANPSFGLLVQQSGDMMVSNCNIAGQGFDLMLTPGSGQSVTSFWAANTFFDTAANGIVIRPGSGGAVARCRFNGCWSSSHSASGAIIGGGGGGVDSVHFVDHESLLNSVVGMVMDTGSVDTVVQGGVFAGNGADGISVNPGVSDFSIIGASAGAYGGTVGNGNGILVNAGASNRYVISLNRTAGNTNLSISDNGTGTSKFVGNNI